MKKILQNEKPKSSVQKLSGPDFPGYGIPATDGEVFEDGLAVPSQTLGLTLERWRTETLDLCGGASYWNPWRGVPGGWRFDLFYEAGFSPAEALARWRDWEPPEEYTPPYEDESWPSHDYD